MRGEFYTDHDIQDLLKQGVRSLTLTEVDRITDLARERAAKGGMRIIWPEEGQEAAPHRYPPIAAPRAAPGRKIDRASNSNDLRRKVRSSVIAKVGADVDPELIEEIIGRVFKQLGVS